MNLDPFITSTANLLASGSHIVNASDIIAAADADPKYINYVHFNLRLIRNALIRHHDLYTHTITDDYVYAYNRDKVIEAFAHLYIPAGARQVWGLRHVTNLSDEIFIASRHRESEYNARRIVTNGDRILDARDANLLALEDCQNLLSTAITSVAKIGGNGMVTEILSKTLNIRIKIENL